MPFKASFLATKGGARTNARAEVVNHDGGPIAGRYAAGNVVANSFGSKCLGGGTTLAPCLAWGRIAALNALSVAHCNKGRAGVPCTTFLQIGV
jgi:3-oxosteroid 1-dehydrogenase